MAPMVPIIISVLSDQSAYLNIIPIEDLFFSFFIFGSPFFDEELIILVLVWSSTSVSLSSYLQEMEEERETMGIS